MGYQLNTGSRVLGTEWKCHTRFLFPTTLGSQHPAGPQLHPSLTHRSHFGTLRPCTSRMMLCTRVMCQPAKSTCCCSPENIQELQAGRGAGAAGTKQAWAAESLLSACRSGRSEEAGVRCWNKTQAQAQPSRGVQASCACWEDLRASEMGVT